MGRRIPVSIYNRLSSTSYRSRPMLKSNTKTTQTETGNLGIAQPRIGECDAALNAAVAVSKIKLHPLLRLALLRSRNISSLKPIQESAFLSILSGKDVTIHAPIGSGKTLSYLLPIVNHIYNIHDLLEELQLNSTHKQYSDKEESIRLKSLGYSRRAPHALLPTTLDDVTQDSIAIENSALQALETQSTCEKLIDTLYKVDPKRIRHSSNVLPLISRSLWGRKSKNAIFRALMSNPLGTVRCCVIVVPNKDLVSQVMNELSVIDPLGRLSVQTLTEVHRIPPPSEKGFDVGSTMSEPTQQPFYPSQHTLHYLKDVPEKLRLSMEDERSMISSIPIKAVSEASVEIVPINKGKKETRMNKIPSTMDLMEHNGRRTYSDDGFIATQVRYERRPVINHPTIQYGSCDIVITTPQLFLNDILTTKRLKVVPACVVFDEVDMLFENNASRRAMMEICSHLRPRPRLYNPATSYRKTRPRELPPCQFIHVASTLNYGGMQTAGSMLYERFTTSNAISTSNNHYITCTDMHFVDVEPAIESKTKRLVELLVGSPFPKTVVFVESLKDVRMLYDLLNEKGWPVLSFHSRSTLATRLSLMEVFRKEEVAIFISTDLLSRGTPLNADHIINFNFPKNAANFVHRLKGRPLRVTNFVEPSDMTLASEICHVYKFKRPINNILSRKRSLRNRRRIASGKSGSGASRRPALSAVNKNVSDRIMSGKPPSLNEEGDSDSIVNPLDYDLTKALDGDNEVYSSAMTASPTVDNKESDIEINSKKEVEYRRISLKKRGFDLYDNFSAFS